MVSAHKTAVEQVVSGSRQPYEEDESDSSSSENGTNAVFQHPEPSELQIRLEAIQDGITKLNKLSAAIRGTVVGDLISKSADIDMSFHEPFDRQRISDRFPKAAVFLVDRIVEANTTRRKLLSYLTRQEEKKREDFRRETGGLFTRVRIGKLNSDLNS